MEEETTPTLPTIKNKFKNVHYNNNNKSNNMDMNVNLDVTPVKENKCPQSNVTNASTNNQSVYSKCLTELSAFRKRLKFFSHQLQSSTSTTPVNLKIKRHLTSVASAEDIEEEGGECESGSEMLQTLTDPVKYNKLKSLKRRRKLSKSINANSDQSDHSETEQQIEIELERERQRRLEELRMESRLKFSDRLNSIYERYSHNFEDDADVIDLRTGQIILDNGHMHKLQPVEFGDILDTCDNGDLEQEDVKEDLQVKYLEEEWEDVSSGCDSANEAVAVQSDLVSNNQSYSEEFGNGEDEEEKSGNGDGEEDFFGGDTGLLDYSNQSDDCSEDFFQDDDQQVYAEVIERPKSIIDELFGPESQPLETTSPAAMAQKRIYSAAQFFAHRKKQRLSVEFNNDDHLNV